MAQPCQLASNPIMNYISVAKMSKCRIYKLNDELIIFRTEKQSAAICDVWTSLTNGQTVGEVSTKLLGQNRVHYIINKHIMCRL